ncbi:MAG: phosphate acetyltransferase [Desulfovibrionaceae bacterium]
MSKTLYVTATESASGKSAVCLGLMQLLLGHLRNVAFFRPIVAGVGQMTAAGAPEEPARDHDIELMLSHFRLGMDYDAAHAFTIAEARQLINEGKDDQLMETILNKYAELEKSHDFVLCLGTDFKGKDPAFEFDLNAEIAANLGAPVLLVISGKGKSGEEIIQSAQLTMDGLNEKSADVTGLIVNRVECCDPEELVDALRVKTRGDLLIYAIPEDESLGKPTVEDVRKWLGAKVLYGHGGLNNLVRDYVIAAMQIGNFLNHIAPGGLIITPGDRSDIILATLTSRLSSSYPDVSGILLTGGLEPSESVHRLIEGWTGVPVPVLAAPDSTYHTIQDLGRLYGRILPDDHKRIASAVGVFESCVKLDELRTRLVSRSSTRVTPVMFEFGLVEKARAHPQRIVLPEGGSDRVLKAADILLRRDVAEIVLLGDPEKILADASQLNLHLDEATIIDPAKSEFFEEYVRTYYDLRKHKCVTEDDARDRMADPAYFGTMMVHLGQADGMVSGSVSTTAATIRPAFEFVKTKPGITLVSSVFFMCLKDRVLVYGDCAVNPNPNAEQLAEIALASAETARIFGIEPRVAMLSYSTGSSGQGADVDKVVEATRIAQERAPDLPLEGPLQYDAAVDPEVAATKLPDSQVAGRATVFIFPDLNTGNNTYKAVQRAAGGVAVGPVLQGLNKPVNDLSRGCTVPDIVNTVAITAIQAQAEKGITQ